jgi:RNA polymerase sigma factor (sigma-70 family)
MPRELVGTDIACLLCCCVFRRFENGLPGRRAGLTALAIATAPGLCTSIAARRNGLARCRTPAAIESEEEAASRIEAISDEDDRLERVDAQATLYAAARHLPRRERQILFLRFGQDLTQTEIAARIGVSQMQVSRLLRSSLQRLRELTENEPRR